jgi:hypothetical protein
MSVSSAVNQVLGEIGRDIKALAMRVGFLERNLGYLIPATTERSDPDLDGVYRKLTHKRRDGTVMQVSVIEHDPLIEIVNGLYNKRVTSIYNRLGTAIVETITHQLRYDTNGVLVSETLI